MNAEILAIGSEITSGQKLDTNSQWLAARLGALGIPVARITAVSDALDDQTSAIRAAAERASLIVIGGGLGPTQDDLTRESLARFAGEPLIEDAESLAAIAALFARRNRTMPDRNRVQALIPRGAIAIPNPVGTAPGIWMTIENRHLICLPGVPHELKSMFEAEVVARLSCAGLSRGVIVHRVINTFGKGESEIEAIVPDLTARGRIPEVGITAHDATISLRIACAAANEAEALAEIEPTARIIRERLGAFIVGEGDDDVPESLAKLLMESQTTFALAESCTGGLAAARLTAIPNISTVFLGGVVSYSNAAKSKLLGVPAALIEKHGAVSPEVAIAMARGACDRFDVALAASITGIAGPGGGSESKPVGLVYLGLADRNHATARELRIGPEQPRHVIQSRAAKHALNWARHYLIDPSEAFPG
jgi:nicotinamide-nucleotide amidase